METVRNSANSSVKVQVDRLDSLVNLAGELVLGRNQLLQAISVDDKRLLETTSQRIDLVTSELQEQIMRTRMQPIGALFDTLPRVVRDLAQQSEKQVNLSTEGKMVELDKSVMQSIERPVIWIIQKAVRCGIELPDERRKRHKQEKGAIKVKARNEAGQVIVDIIDDGAGVNPDMIVDLAADKGLLPKDQQAMTYSRSEKMGLVFLPGLLSHQDASGVLSQFAGMGDIKSEIEQLGGTFEIDAEAGMGSSVRMKLPLTLSIIPSQIIELGQERFAIPQLNLSELLRVPANQVKDAIEKVGGAEVIRLRRELLPLIDLAKVLGINRSYTDMENGHRCNERRNRIADRRSGNRSVPDTDYDGPERRADQDRRSRPESALNIAVVSTGKYKYGMVVDAMHDTEEIVVKPLGKHLVNCSGFAGATIMGDGKVALILDVSSIGTLGGIKTEMNQTESTRPSQSRDAEGNETAVSGSYLFFSNSESERIAVPLDKVQRIEKVEAKRIESISGNRVLQYRGGSLPLVSLDDSLIIDPLPDKDHYQVICFTINGRDIGVLATSPIDAAEVAVDLDTKTLSQPGVVGSAVIKGQTTLILEIEHVARNARPDFFHEECVNE